MSTTEIPTVRVLRRTRDGRVGAGVASGLGRYFGLDPVLFRVLFATAAFFGGAGVIAYLLAWVAIPEEGTARAPIDGVVAELRRRRVPVWAVATALGLLVWVVGFSWWAPGPFIPVLAVVIVLIVAFGRNEWRRRPPTPAVDLTKHDPTDPTWVGDLRSWVDESKVAHRQRRSRALPVKLAVLGTLIPALVVLGIVDGVHGVELQVYFWTALGIVVGGLLVGAALRRTPWSLTGLLVPVVAGTVAFAGSHASLHDGTGDRDWQPTASLHSDYRLAFGRGTLDLTRLSALTTSRTVTITVAAGQVHVIAPAGLSLQVDAHIRFGRFVVDGDQISRGAGVTAGDGRGSAGAPQLTVDIRLSAGEVIVDHRR